MPITDIQAIELLADISPTHRQRVLTPNALAFIEQLHLRFNQQRLSLLAARQQRQTLIDEGQMPDFLPHTAHIRQSDWTIAPLPSDLQDRRVEITGPVERKMVINALNSGANVFMADFEDANAPTWDNCLDGHINLQDAIRRTISYHTPQGKTYSLNAQTAVLMVRPRGWHLNEKHVRINGEPVSGALFDFGLYFFHNAHELIARQTAPYFYLPKLESHLEARLWNEVFEFSQAYLSIPKGTIKATVLIETIVAAFEMHEILYELKEHSAGLNCGRWDYIFSFIKKTSKNAAYILPDRAQVTMTTPFMRSYSLLAISTCHRRKAPAMGGMAAFIPIKNDPQANEQALEKVRNDKQREASDGHDGTWVAHPALVPIAKQVFDQLMPTPNQIDRNTDHKPVTAADLLAVPTGKITKAGLRQNINVAILYIESWLNGVGAVALYNLMEDAATAEISRAQIWQWLHHQAKLDDGTIITKELYTQLLAEEIENIKKYVGEERYNKGKFGAAIALFDQLVTSEQFAEFLTLPAYDLL